MTYSFLEAELILSSLNQIKSGVCQGSVVSSTILKSIITGVLDGHLPTLFHNSVHITCLAYVYDVLLISRTHEALQSNLDRLLHGFSIIGLQINRSKSDFIVFNCSYPVSLSVGTCAISSVDL